MASRSPRRVRVVGVLSGTSCDAIDVAIVDVSSPAEPPAARDDGASGGGGSGVIASHDGALSLRLIAYEEVPWAPAARAAALAAGHAAAMDLTALGALHAVLGDAFAGAVLAVLEAHGGAADLVASHGQTVHHVPGASSLQVRAHVHIHSRGARHVMLAYPNARAIRRMHCRIQRWAAAALRSWGTRA